MESPIDSGSDMDLVESELEEQQTAIFGKPQAEYQTESTVGASGVTTTNTKTKKEITAVSQSDEKEKENRNEAGSDHQIAAKKSNNNSTSNTGNNNINNREEIVFFLESNGLSHLTQEMTSYENESLNLNRLISIVCNDNEFDNFCHLLNIKLADKIKIRSSIDSIKKKIETIEEKNNQLKHDTLLMNANNKINDKKEEIIPCKVCIIGNGYVGKTSIISRFVNDEFLQTHHATYGYSYNFKKMSINSNQIIKFGLWDTSGQEMYYSTTIRYYKDANVVIIVYDGNDSDSFNIAKQRLIDVLQFKFEEIENNNKNGEKVIAVVANKCDLKTENNNESWQKQKNEIESMKGVNLYFETSAKQNINIDELFDKIISCLDIEKLNQFNKMIQNKNSLIVDGSAKMVVDRNNNGKNNKGLNSISKARCCT